VACVCVWARGWGSFRILCLSYKWPVMLRLTIEDIPSSIYFPLSLLCINHTTSLFVFDYIKTSIIIKENSFMQRYSFQYLCQRLFLLLNKVMECLVEQELLTLPEHLSLPAVFSGVRVTRSFVLCVCFVDRCFSYCTFSFGHCVVSSFSIYGF